MVKDANRYRNKLRRAPSAKDIEVHSKKKQGVQSDPGGCLTALLPTLVFSHQVIGFTQVRCDCIIGTMDIEKSIRESAEEVRKEVTLQGFRQRKAPLNLIISKKWDAIEERARKRLFEQATKQIQNELSSPELAPIAPPIIENEESVRIKELKQNDSQKEISKDAVNEPRVVEFRKSPKLYMPLHFSLTWPVDARQAQIPGMADNPQAPQVPGMPSIPALPNIPGVPRSAKMPGSIGQFGSKKPK